MSLRRHLAIPRLPLAVYREIAAHLQAIDGVRTGLLPQTSREFDYLQSQVGGLWIETEELPTGSGAIDPAAPEAVATAPATTDSSTTHADLAPRQRLIEDILAHYGDRFGPWQTLSSSP